MELKPGDKLGPYEIVSRLRAGGMGEVWKARDTRLDRIVAIKTSAAQFTDRFAREARAVAALNHPNICTLHDVGPDYLVMEFVEGAPVSRPDSPRKLLDIAVQIADGLAAAHAARIVHRDLKPDNILITREGRVKILDFGLAKEAHAELGPDDETRTIPAALTDPGTTVGTIAYMSPEQARGQRNLTPQSDQFSLGLVLYELAAGKKAFQRSSPLEIMVAIIREDAEPLPASVPAPFRWIVERLLHKEPGERYVSTLDLYRELRQWRDGIALPAPFQAASSNDSSTNQTFSTLPPDRPSIAVLPFLNLSGDTDREYVADAITEDIVTALSRWRWFFVISRNSSFSYKGRSVDAKRIGRELGVRYLLEGSVQQSRDRLRVTGQLIDVAINAHIWADSLDRNVADIFALQDEFTERVVNAIEPAILERESLRVARKNPSDLGAFSYYQRGMWHFNKHSEAGHQEALSLFRAAIELDSELSLGYIGLARALYDTVVSSWSREPERDLSEARQAAKTAIELDPRDAYGHFALSGAALYLGMHEEALAEARDAIKLNPNFAFGHFRLGQVLTSVGRAAEAIPPIERSIRHSPFDPQLGAMHAQLALAHYHAGNHTECIHHARSATRLGFVLAYGVLAASLARLSSRDEARQALMAFLPEFQQRLSSKTFRMAPYANAADQERLFDGLRSAGLDRAMLDAAV
jgi:TolB-like protein/Flp pilus assembly protein TadD